jgi:hypothetical protein
MGRIGPDSACFRGSPVIARAGMQFESHLGHSVSAGQMLFAFLLLTKLDFSKLFIDEGPQLLLSTRCLAGFCS